MRFGFMIKLVSALMLVNSQTSLKSSEPVVGWCDPYETFCLFSPGSNLFVSNLLQAQQICTASKENSWPLEIHHPSVSNALDQLLNNLHLSGSSFAFVLNAEMDGKKWKWINNNSTIRDKNCNVSQIMGFQNNSITCFDADDAKFQLICVADCFSSWEVYNRTGMDHATNSPITTIDECKSYCERDRTNECVAVEWNINMSFNSRCWFHQNKSGNISFNFIVKNDATMYIINRTIKSVDVCLNDFKTYVPSIYSSVGNIASRFI
ncbi:hypothetical protein HELRODRAFT_177400 [Helobdella robusta]|uniref:Apple domain-containing protein n=1 Tax=Helobdella robusta TaxID=6412 RepID=T1FBM7_HELRO|nr:hypothetical protein HELRODRAFT_177400 [Helobdella robusta]ESN98157.1 hypothetical protein HELRODRAFT_177400 [Helobdella robusta]